MEKDNSKIDKFIAALYASGKEMGVSKELMTQILTSSLDKLEAEINATKTVQQLPQVLYGPPQTFSVENTSQNNQILYGPPTNKTQETTDLESVKGK